MPINTPRFDGCGTGGGGGISELTGDVTAGPGSGSQAATVVGLQGSPVSAVAPADGQVLTWNGATWVPGAPAAGGSGGGGQTWFLNGGTAGGPPIVGLPASVKDLDLTAEVAASTITSGALPTGGVYAFVAGFVTDPGEPGLTAIPAGIWDFNIWASSSAPQPNTTIFRVKVYSYDGTAPTLIATGSATPLYDPGTTIQYLASVLVPQTVLTVADRIYVEIEGTATSAGHTLTISLGGSTPTHTHTTLPSVAGTGIVHVVNGVMQSPASPVDLSGGATEITGTLPVGNGGTGTGTVPANGELLIGDGTGYTLATLTDGANVSITEGAGSITIDAVPSGAANEIQINSGGTAFGADPNLTFDGVNLTVATGGSTIDIGQGFITGGPSLTVETMLGGTLTLGNGDVVDLVAAQEIRVNGATGAAGEVLTSNGPGVPPTWQAGGGGGTIGGTIAANEVAFGTALDTIGGDPAFLFDGVNLTVATGGSTIDLGQGFVTGGPSLTVETMLGGTLTLGNGDAIDLVAAQEIRVNGATGAAGEVLTSNGPGVPPTWQAGGGGGGGATEITDTYYVDAVLGNDLTADGSISLPYATIQACLVAIGNPTSKQDACRKITVQIAPAHSAAPGIIASQANNFDGIYQENLWVPSRQITFVGPGIKIGNAGDASGFGNVTQEISTARRFGASSSELRHTMTFVGRANARDTHNRVRNGMHIGGITRVSVIQRNIATIQGDSVGGTRVTITLSAGQNPYGVAVSPYAQLAVTLTDAGDLIGYTSPTGVAIANSANANQMVFFKSIAGTTGPSLDTYYYVVNATASTFQLSTSIGGPAIALTGDGSGVIMAKPGYAPFEDLVRFRVAGTTNYGTTAATIAYDVIEKLSDTSFIAKRVTGTNTSAAVEAVGTITETDSTGSSTSITHDIRWDSCYQQGAFHNDDGAIYSGAPTSGQVVLYAKDSRFNAGFLAGGGTVQRWENSQAVLTTNAGATVTSYSRTTNVVTVITSSTSQWSTGQIVTITSSASGGGQSIDGTWTILAGGTNQFTLSQTGADYGTQTPTVSSSISAVSVWSTIVTMAQATFSGAGVQLGSTPFTLSTDDQGVSNTRFGVTRLYTSTTSAMPLARFDAYTSHWLYAGGAVLSFPVTFTDAGDTVTRTAHGLSNGAIVRFSGIVNTTGISTATDYYVVGVTANTFQVALTPGGAAIALTTNGTGTLDVAPLYYPAFLDTYVPTQQFTGNQWVQTSTVTLANSTVETSLIGAGAGMLNFPANFLKLGRNLRISGSGYFSCTAATPTLRIQVKLGAVIIADTTAIAMPVAESNRGFTFDLLASVRAVGASGSVFASGAMVRMATTLAMVPLNVLSVGVPVPVTIATTSAQALTVTATWGTADPGNSISLTNLVVSA